MSSLASELGRYTATEMIDVRKEYQQLVARRRACRACAGLENPAVVAGGAFDHQEIGPWSAWQGRLDAQVMVVGQDYSDVAYFERRSGVEDSSNPTNLNLVALFASIGIVICAPGTRQGRGEVFFTNAILCLKRGGMQSKVRPEWFVECGKRFLRAQIELIRPKVVVGLGERAHNAVRSAFGLPPEPIRRAVTSPGDRLPTGAFAIGVYHCGARVVNIARNLELQRTDWQRVAAVLRAPAV